MYFFENLLKNSLIKIKLISNCDKSLIRCITTTSALQIKEIRITQEDKTTVIEGITTDSERKLKLLPQACINNFCPECTLGLKLKHTDVLILSQYVRSDGCMLPNRITGLCRRQHRRINAMVTMAQKAGLMPNLAPANSKRDPKVRFQWKKFNKYYDEQTIKC